MTLAKNVGKTDRNFRLAAGGVLILAAIMIPSLTVQVTMTLVGLVLLATGAMGVCPAYMPLKINTIKEGED